jgi:hypothetical protein
MRLVKSDRRDVQGIQTRGKDLKVRGQLVAASATAAACHAGEQAEFVKAAIQSDRQTNGTKERFARRCRRNTKYQARTRQVVCPGRRNRPRKIKRNTIRLKVLNVVQG